MPPVLIPELEKPKRKRTKPEGEPKNVTFKSTKGDVSFTARSRKKLPDPEPVLQDIEDVPKQEEASRPTTGLIRNDARAPAYTSE